MNERLDERVHYQCIDLDIRRFDLQDRPLSLILRCVAYNAGKAGLQDPKRHEPNAYQFVVNFACDLPLIMTCCSQQFLRQANYLAETLHRNPNARPVCGGWSSFVTAGIFISEG